jgi:hypothetical protein
MSRIRVDTDLLFKNAETIHDSSADFLNLESQLPASIQSIGGGCPALAADARKDACAAQDLIRSIRRRLEAKADTLAALGRAFRSVDDEAITALIALRGEGWLRQTFFTPPFSPDIEGFEPEYLPQTRMLRTDWVPVFVQGRNGLTQVDTFHTGKIADNVIGLWTDPKTGKKYYIFEREGIFYYLPESKSGNRIDGLKIPDRGGLFPDGAPLNAVLPHPFGPDDRDPAWYAAGDPWQNLILGKMDIRGIGGAAFDLVPHHNLCGELSVFFCVGEPDLPAGFSRFAQMRNLGYWNPDGSKTEYTGTQVLQDPDHATSAYDLRRLFEDYGWQAEISNGALPPPDELAEKISSGERLVFLTELDVLPEKYSAVENAMTPNPAYGQLVAGAPPQTPGRAAHWVTVTDVFQDGDGGICVEVFNTYSGKKESYSWETFVGSCRQPGNQVGSFAFLDAAPPASRVDEA